MGLNVTRKIIEKALVSGRMEPGEPIEIRIDQTLTQDATGTMADLQFECLEIDRVRVEKAVSYVDHNTAQMDHRNPDDHRYLQSFAARYGLYFSRPGNGICHQVHLERFAAPGKTLLGSDSHTPTAGGMGMLAIGAGGLDVAIAMAGGPFSLRMPRVCRVVLNGRLRPWVTAKDVILELLRRETVKGGVGWIYEYAGDALRHLTVPERATITNMGAELGATTSIFPSDEQTRIFLEAQGRADDWVELTADDDAEYDREIVIDLDELAPMAACPHMPDVVKTVAELEDEGVKVDQVAIGSCTNSSYKDLATVAAILEGRTCHPDVVLGVSPGSRQVLRMLADEGKLSSFISFGARMLESACGPCIGMGFAPPTGSVTVRTFNRNFKGRCGTKSAGAYLVSPPIAAICAIEGRFLDPTRHPEKYPEFPDVEMPERFTIDDAMIIPPLAPEEAAKVEIVRGPNIAPCPKASPVKGDIRAKVVIKVGDNITTDDIMPAGKYLPLRSNVPEYSKVCFVNMDAEFAERCRKYGSNIIIGGENYGQGSSREHAALCPMYLGVKAVMAKSFARIHLANLINFGILPLTFVNPDDYEKMDRDDEIVVEKVDEQVKAGSRVKVKNVSKGVEIEMEHPLQGKQVEVLLAGGALNHAASTLKR